MSTIRISGTSLGGALAGKVVTAFLGLIIVGLVLAALLAWPIQALWNSTVPGLFHLREIGFWEAFRLGFLARVLFGTGNGSSSSKAD